MTIPVDTVFVDDKVFDTFLKPINVNQSNDVRGIRTMWVFCDTFSNFMRKVRLRYSPMLMRGRFLQLKGDDTGVMFYVSVSRLEIRRSIRLMRRSLSWRRGNCEASNYYITGRGKCIFYYKATVFNLLYFKFRSNSSYFIKP